MDRPAGFRWFYITMTVALTAMVLTGFWPEYYGPLLRGDRVGEGPPGIVHLHGAVFLGWMLLLLAQSWLVASRRVQLHRRVGRWALGYGALILLTGIAVAFLAPAHRVRHGAWSLEEAAAFLILPLGDLLLFAGFFSAGMHQRRRPERHKRLILATTLVLIYPGVARMGFESPWVTLLVWLSPLLVAMAHDLVRQGRIHGVHWITALVLTGAFMRVFVMDSPGWVGVGRALLHPFL